MLGPYADGRVSHKRTASGVFVAHARRSTDSGSSSVPRKCYRLTLDDDWGAFDLHSIDYYGVATTIVSGQTYSGVVGDEIALECIGSTIRVLKNSTVLYSTTNTDWTTGYWKDDSSWWFTKAAAQSSFTDSFTAGDATELRSPWRSKTSADPKIYTNRAQSMSAASYGTECESAGADSYVEAGNTPAAANLCVFGRCDPRTGIRYMATWQTLNEIRLYKYMTNWTSGLTLIASVSTSSPVANNSRVRMELEGTTIRVYRVDSGVKTLMITSTGRTELTTGRNGMWFIANGNVLDNYDAGPLSVPVTAKPYPYFANQ